MLRKIMNGLEKILELLTALSMGVLVVDVTWQVITRFILKNPSNWTEELATFLMIWVGLLGSAVALNRGAHLGIDYFVGKLSLKKRLYTEIFVYLCIASFSICVMLFGGFRLVTLTFMQGQVSPALNLPMGFVYLSVPIAGFFLAFYSLEFLGETMNRVMKSRGELDRPSNEVAQP
jgi:TRAP-type C4-dicarboxylate transport system permease small subunit